MYLKFRYEDLLSCGRRFTALAFFFTGFAVAGAQEPVGLKEIAPFPVGASISARWHYLNAETVALHEKHFDSVTAGNAMKMHLLLPEEGKYNWEAVDAMIDRAEAAGQRVFGHTLIWHSSTPDWVVEKYTGDPEGLDAFMREYIHTVVGRYRGRVAAWDVVNEAMETVGGEYRKTFWYETLGKDYIAKAFHYAHEADPEAVLFYNDFNTERDMEKLDGALAMVEDLQRQNVPVSGFGFQMHTRMDIPDAVIAEALQKGAATGLQIHLSEVDVIFNKHDDTRGGGIQIYDEVTDEMLEQQGEKYKNIVLAYRRAVPPENQFGITFWGFNDRFTWIRPFFGLKDWPCIFDEELQPKPAFYGFAEGLTAEL